MIPLAAAVGIAAIAAGLRWTPHRFEVVEESMAPALRHGDYIVTVASKAYAVGDIVVYTHPQRPGFALIKRVVEPPSPIGPDSLWVLGDNHDASTSDSRELGPVARDAVVGRATFRYYPIQRIGRIGRSSVTP